MTSQLQKSRHSHDLALQGQTYQTSSTVMEKVQNPDWSSKSQGVKKWMPQEATRVQTHQQTIPLQGINSGHHTATNITRKNGDVVDGATKRGFKG
jgi:hypothetical protein